MALSSYIRRQMEWSPMRRVRPIHFPNSPTRNNLTETTGNVNWAPRRPLRRRRPLRLPTSPPQRIHIIIPETPPPPPARIIRPCGVWLCNLKNETNETNGENDCSICLERMKQRKIIHLLCGHDFHHNCINQWKKLNNSCPLCRSIID